MTSKQCVAIDVDDTIAHFSDEVARVLSKISKTKVPYSKWESHNWADTYPIDVDHARAAVRTYVDYSSLRITSGIWPELHTKIEGLGYEPIYITARESILGDTARGVTLGWMRMMGIPVMESQIITTTFSTRKGTTLKSLGYDVVASVEDNPRDHKSYILEYPKGYHILVDTPINRNSGERISSNRMWPVVHPREFVSMRSRLIQHISNLR